ncbi:COP1-interactive protein 1-like isoform X2 [Astatotilapia calliptera]|uniref:COP1-interactive protein 1-like isoform X2 n=1 Tax=Astatotilapia calliptera TaxID=8154 RepID=UPI000E4084F4|nr:COP1-interactive protein 1-like isoform X2 [Astatotilapia calliptera]
MWEAVTEKGLKSLFIVRRMITGCQDFCRWRTMARRSAALFLLLCCSVSRGQSEASVPPPAVISQALPILWDELRGLKELVLSLKAEEVGRRQILRRVESWLRDGEVQAEQQRRSLEGLKEEALRQAEELRGRVEELEEQSKARAADVSTLQSRLNSSERSTDDLKKKNSALAAELPFLQTRLRASESTVEQLRRKNAVLAARLCNTESLMEELRQQISEFPASNASSLTPDMLELEARLGARLEELSADAEVESAEVSALGSRLSEAERRLDELHTQTSAVTASWEENLLAVKSQVQQLELTGTAQTDSVKQLQLKLNSTEHQIHELQTETSDQSSKLTKLQTNVSASASLQGNLNTEIMNQLRDGEKRLEQLKAEHTAQTDSVKQLQLKLNSTEHQIHELQTETSDQSSKLTKLQTNVSASASLQGNLNTEMFTRLRRGDKQLEQLLSEHTAVDVRLRSSETQLEQLDTRAAGRDIELLATKLRLNVTKRQVDELTTQNTVRAAELESVSDRLTAAQRRADGELRVAFSAGLTDSGSVGPFDEETTLIFSKIITNIGEAYNQTAGVFTAPVSGLYVFSFTAADYLKGYMGLYLYKNDKPIVFSLDLNDHGGYASTSNAVCLQLEEGDRVHLGLPASYRLYDDSRNFSVFSGFLLFHL